MMETAAERYSRLAAPLLLAAFVALAYYPALDADFVFDDMPNIVFNRAVHPEGLRGLGAVFSSTVSASRPLALLTFALNYLAGGMNPFGYHLVNTAIHAANGIILYAVFMQVFAVVAGGREDIPAGGGERASWSFYGAALWAMNPVQSQAVTYIVQRMTSLAAMFYLLAILVHLLRRRERIAAGPATAAIALFFLLGLACKEIVLSLPAALLVIDFCLFPGKAKKSWPVLAAFLTAAVVTGFFMNGGSLPDLTAPWPERGFSPVERVMTQGRILWHYLGLVLAPLPSRLHLTYGIAPSRGLFSPWTTAAGLSAMAAAIAWAVYIRKKRPLAALAVLFYFTGHAIEAGPVNLELAFIHRLYLPTAFLPLIVLPRPGDTARLRRIAPLLLAAIALFSFWTVRRNLEWNATPGFWSGNIERGANTARSWNNLAASLIDNGRLDEALAAIDRGMKLAVRREDQAMLAYNRGYALFFLGRTDEAQEAFRQVAKKFGAYRHTILLLGLTELRKGNLAAVERLAARLAQRPAMAYQAGILRARLAMARRDYRQAEKELLAARKATTGAELYVRQRVSLELVRLYLTAGRMDRAYATLVEMIREFPQNYSAWRLIRLMLKSGGDAEHAAIIEKFLKSRGVRLRP